MKLQPGYRAISVPVDQVTSNSGLLSRKVVDILYSNKDGELLRYGNSSQELALPR